MNDQRWTAPASWANILLFHSFATGSSSLEDCVLPKPMPWCTTTSARLSRSSSSMSCSQHLGECHQMPCTRRRTSSVSSNYPSTSSSRSARHFIHQPAESFDAVVDPSAVRVRRYPMQGKLSQALAFAPFRMAAPGSLYYVPCPGRSQGLIAGAYL
ncbi:uncharacterized protein PHACADRAFT_253414 [Phanerochaete carnosa HHB-10118-sp]|uniref:Uncharacterized protein n=1 Tax=Phanerochaete carnosa (strain HHB-10118-sp) TaxID=650164 RepID=K5VXQ8_PHACS|nr:uncharacterized protein PHACADRAFT_253414 [Phanerochaete carnosa HHB-10118-sp]EKM56343.1 hypothetical protein PHACADRAFT_253414 [Phanerochaete carnosa HHB-10118-sp]